ncbi:hypothetical protein SUGI_0675620 [Cryptomeria japonica]|nr:hypothetical protein SUGI_0675620 [Cryptomeria japonica]
MLQTKAKIILVFYDVEPSALHHIEKGEYAMAFAKYEEKERYIGKLKDWKEALQSVSFLIGHKIRGNSKFCLDKLVEDFERQCQTKVGDKDKAQIVDISGMGGVGKTILAKELFNRKRPEYTEACFLFDEPTVEFLVVIDDIDHLQQLDAVLIINMLNRSGNSLVIVTTHDVGVLINTGITVSYNLKGTGTVEAEELFCWHAFRQPHPSSGYEKLVEQFVDVCGGLLLSLKVLGSHVHDTNQDFWELELEKVNKMLPRHISIPPWIPLQNLQSLQITHENLERLWQTNEQAPFVLKELRIYGIDKLEELSLGLLRRLEVLAIYGCGHLKILRGISDLTKLEHLNTVNCGEFEELSLVQLSCLKEIRINGCGHLKSVTRISDLTKLQDLNIDNCGELEKSSLVQLSCIKEITIHGCGHLKSLRGISNLKKLEDLKALEKLSLVKSCSS